ncbi:MAG: zinc-ribbon domain-containing protein [Rickettsiales bacterium]|jgi:predicted Zn finger-like uncharacterized protein|nr:zinc-ribbon domain-containing protein [Rickettsiales bacterium]
MIISCPKCKTEFEVEDGVFSAGDVRFQCSECGFSWLEPKRLPKLPAERLEKAKLMKSLGIRAAGTRPRAGAGWGLARAVLNLKNAAFFTVGAAFVLVFSLLARLAIERAPAADDAKRAAMLSMAQKESAGSDALEIEVVRPLESEVQGSDIYVMLKGFVHNSTNRTLPVPKLVVRLLNRQGRILQEQEREIEARELGPGQDADFAFRIYMFSDQIYQFRVDFAAEGKI